MKKFKFREIFIIAVKADAVWTTASHGPVFDISTRPEGTSADLNNCYNMDIYEVNTIL